MTASKAQAEKAKKTEEFGFYRKNVDDTSDIAFFIKGVHFRWINDAKQESSADRPWTPFTREIVKAQWPAFYKELSEKRKTFWTDDGFHRWGKQWLGFMMDDTYAIEKARIDRENLEQQKRINAAPESGDNRFKVKVQEESSEFDFSSFKN